MKHLKATYITSFTAVLAVFILMVGCKKPPRASFTCEVQNGGIVKFTNTSAGKLDAFAWSFGDGNVSGETNPVHRYLAAGRYNVTLTVTNGDGSDSYSKTVNIEAGVQENIGDHPQFVDAHGYFYARNTLEFEKNTPSIYNDIRASAIAALYDSTNFLVSVGRVSCNGIELTNNADNSYSFHSPDSSVHFRDEVRWTADGGNGFPPIVENVPKSFPEIEGLVGDTFKIGTDTTYLLKTASQILFADSAIWTIQNSAGTIIAQKATAGNVSGVFFEKDELTSLTVPGTYITKVVAYSFIRKTYQFKVVYYTKESYTQSTFIAK